MSIGNAGGNNLGLAAQLAARSAANSKSSQQQSSSQAPAGNSNTNNATANTNTAPVVTAAAVTVSGVSSAPVTGGTTTTAKGPATMTVNTSAAGNIAAQASVAMAMNAPFLAMAVAAGKTGSGEKTKRGTGDAKEESGEIKETESERTDGKTALKDSNSSDGNNAGEAKAAGSASGPPT